MDLAECVLKKNIFEHNLSFLKQIRGTPIGTKMAPPYAIIFMGDLEERILQSCSFKPLVWWRYIDDIFLLWQHEEEKLKETLDILNRYHPSIKFTSKYSRERIDFLDVEIIKEGNRLLTYLSNPLTPFSTFMQLLVMHITQKNPYRTVRLCVLTRFAPRINFLIRGVMI